MISQRKMLLTAAVALAAVVGLSLLSSNCGKSDDDEGVRQMSCAIAQDNGWSQGSSDYCKDEDS